MRFLAVNAGLDEYKFRVGLEDSDQNDAVSVVDRICKDADKPIAHEAVEPWVAFRRMWR